MSQSKDSRPVYSTDLGRICPECTKAVTSCECRTRAKLAPLGDGNVRMRLEKNGRGGKVVTTISGLPLSLDQLTQLTSELKRACGSGGTVKDGVIEIQGDRRDLIEPLLMNRGWRVKRSGG